MEDNVINAGDDLVEVDKIIEENNKEEQGDILLPITNQGEVIDPLMLPSITASGLTFKKRDNITAHGIYGSSEFLVFFAYDKESDLEWLKNVGIIIDNKSEADNKDRTVYLNLTTVMGQAFDWTESIVTTKNCEKVFYKYIIHSIYNNVDIYITFNKGTLYPEVVDSMYNTFVENFDKIKELKDRLEQLIASSGVNKDGDE